MELRHLRYFVAVAETLSFTKGAEKLRIAQPSLTRQIKDLEEELGMRLLDRSKRHVRLTGEGEAFLTGARRLLNESAQIVESIQKLSRQTTVSISIAYVANSFHIVLPSSLAAFEKRFPTASINLVGMSCGDQFQALKDGKIDLGFVGLCGPVEEPGLRSRLVATHKGVGVLPRSNRLRKRGTVKLRDLEAMFFVVLSDAVYSGHRRWLTAVCQKAGFRPKILQTADDESMLLQAIRCELGMSILPESIKKFPHDSVVIRDVTPAVLFPSYVVWKTDNPSESLKGYLEVITDLGKRTH
jgi:DNA-binding transcriptional LysR family regulator